MPRHSIVIGSSLAAALLVLALTLWLGHRPTPPPDGEGEGPPAPAAPSDAEPLPPFDPDRVVDADLAAQSQVFEGVQEGYTIVEGDRRVIMTWDELEPQPQGVYEVVGPRTWIFFDPTRVLRIEAQRGTLVAPENQPQEGDLLGGVTLTFFRSEDGDLVDLDTLRDAQVQARLDSASFNLVLGHIESDSPVRITGRQVAFRGQGLSLTYNERRKRIERLEVAQGESLRFKPDTEEGEQRSEVRKQRSEGSHEVTQVVAPSPSAPSQFYRAQLQDNVRVTVGHDEAHQMAMTADALAAVFSLDTQAESEGDDDEAPSTAPATSEQTGPATQPARAVDAADSAVPDAQPEPDLFIPGSEDVVVEWTGPLLLLPLDKTPADFAGSDDLMLSLTGSPAAVRTADDETIRSRTIDYLASRGRLRAGNDRVGSDEQGGVQLASAELGELTGRHLVINQSEGEGVITGPGTLRAAIDADDVPHDDTQSPQSGTPDELRISWQDRLDLTFYLEDENERDADLSSLDGGGRIRALRSAHFHGDVQTRHPRFELVSDAQRIAFDESAADQDDSVLRRIDATGNVSLHAQPEDEQPLELQTESLAVHLEEDAAGDIQPRRIVAQGGVRTSQPDQRLSTRHLELIFAAVPDPSDHAATQPAPAPATQSAPTQPSDPPALTARAGIERMIATGEVRVELDDPAMELVGDRLIADAAADQIELIAPEDDQAYVVREDGVLAGRHIVMRESDRSVEVEGAGWFDAQLAANEPTDQLRVTWQRAMRYDDQSGLARFAGRVRAATRDAGTTARLTSETLRLQLTKAAPPAAHDAPAPEADSDEDDLGRRIHTATARGDVVFLAEQREAETGELRTRLNLEGPQVNFNATREQVRVVGRGRMLIEDRRPASAADQAADQEADESAPMSARFSGRGDTLFEWGRRLTLDVADNTVRMEGGVQMVHRPRQILAEAPSNAPRNGHQNSVGENRENEPNVMQLDSEVLFADLEDTGGLGGWAASDSAAADESNPDVQLVRADGNVRVLYDRGRNIVRSDHLQYTADDQLVRLWADEGNQVRIERPGQPTNLSFREGFWNLATDAFDARELGPGIVPITE